MAKSALSIALFVLTFQFGRHQEGTDKTAILGRGPALPENVVNEIIGACSSVTDTKVTQFSATMLRPVAIGVIICLGYGMCLVQEELRRQGRFHCSTAWLCLKFKINAMRFKASAGDTDKLPVDWQERGYAMVLRGAYLVYVHQIPPSLVSNADHTGLHNVSQKGGSWHSAAAVKAKDFSVQGGNDKEQQTALLLVGFEAAPGKSRVGPAQLIMKGMQEMLNPCFSDVHAR